VTDLLGFIAGFVDTCAFFALYGVFVAQVTGSFVLAGARLVSGQQELMTLSAIPTFFLAGAAATALAIVRLPGRRALSWVLALECGLLTAMLALMMTASLDGRDSAPVILAALLGIAAMGVQSAAVRLFMSGAPSTNVMTTNTTQLAIDATILIFAVCGCGEAEQTRQSQTRFSQYWVPMAGFVVGTALGALSFRFLDAAALAAPLLGAYALLGWTIYRR